KEDEYVILPAADFDKAERACKAFGCQPYFAIVVDAAGTIRVFITPTAHVLQLFPRRATGSGWKMTPSRLVEFARDPQIMMFELQVKSGRWWQ
ncbi:MAG: hypothetical protein KJ070_18350, partial [Verrucomicrobia bacterium]|nr:hypothetical protein [Verrucomicrobiota bacterium]